MSDTLIRLYDEAKIRISQLETENAELLSYKTNVKQRIAALEKEEELWVKLVGQRNAENAALRAALEKCFSYFGRQIKCKTLDISAADGTQALSRELAALLDASAAKEASK